MFPRYAVLWMLSLASLTAQKICPPTPAYGVCDIEFDVSGNGARDLHAEFRGPSHRTYLVNAFPSDAGHMIIRFSPSEAGTWDVRLSDGKTLQIQATASDAPGWIEIGNVNHFRYSNNGPAHLWVGGRVPDGLDRAAFERFVLQRARLKVNHLQILAPKKIKPLEAWNELDARLAFLNAHGITAELVLTPPAGDSRDARHDFFRETIARCAARNLTWMILDNFENYPSAHELVREIAGYLNEDPYHRLRTVGARITSAPFADEKWMSYRSYGSGDPSVSAVEDQIYPSPAVSDFTGGEGLSADEFRHRLWNATMTGAYPAPSVANDTQAGFLKIWQEVFADTRHWDLQPFFDAEGARGMALPDTEFVLYVEKPGPVTVHLENKHSWEASWIDPINGERTDLKKFKEDVFTGEPPDSSHDWVLHISREGRKESMLKSYRFEAAPTVLQELEADPKRVPFEIAQPSGESIPFGKPSPFAIKLLRETRATRSMQYLWTGEVTADGEGYRVLGTGAQGNFTPPPGIARRFPATLHIRLFGLNANGKLYTLDRNFGLTQ